MRIDFDMCCLQRPIDDQTQLRVRVEAQAVLGILALCEDGRAELIASEALVFRDRGESGRCSPRLRHSVDRMAVQFVQTDASVKSRAQQFMAAGIQPLDALHLASAVEAHADFFCTCDDRFLKKLAPSTRCQPKSFHHSNWFRRSNHDDPAQVAQ